MSPSELYRLNILDPLKMLGPGQPTVQVLIQRPAVLLPVGRWRRLRHAWNIYRIAGEPGTPEWLRRHGGYLRLRILSEAGAVLFDAGEDDLRVMAIYGGVREGEAKS